MGLFFFWKFLNDFPVNIYSFSVFEFYKGFFDWAELEIEDNDWDRIRVDFERDDDDDHRVEVRLNDGSIRIRVD